MKNEEFFVYDTSALLERVDDLFTEKENIVIPSVVLEELDNLKEKKTNPKVRKLIRLLRQHENDYEVYLYNSQMQQELFNLGLEEISPDSKILATAISYDKNEHPDETIFVTNDIHLQIIANLYFGEDSIQEAECKNGDNYNGYIEINMTDEELADFYENQQKENKYHLFVNQYLIIKNLSNEVIDVQKWTGAHYEALKYESFESTMFGKIKPKKNDIFQNCAFDSLKNNQITMLKGPAGTGKSFLALSYLMMLLERNIIDKIIIFCNTVATANSAHLGFYPGSRDEKLLDSQIGNFLYSKLGKFEVDKLMAEEKLILLPMSDIRGYDTSGMNAGIYITEAQNMDISLMKLALQRVGEDSIVVIDGDCETQVDDRAFADYNNGMKRLSQVFRGQDMYGEVKLQNIHRSKIAKIAELM